MKKVCIFLIMLGMVACKQKTPQKVFSSHSRTPVFEGKIDIDFDKPVSPSVFEFFKSIELIPLETNEESVIDEIVRFVEDNDN